MVKYLVAPVVLALAIGGSIPSVEAARGNVVTSCEPFQPFPGAHHQKCTSHHLGPDGSVLFTTVYFIDENGMWYLLP